MSEPIAMEEWGQDHWSTLAYLETIQVDGKGHIDRSRMRTDRAMHPDLAWNPRLPCKYPTRLKGRELAGHDDWSCVEDMAAAKLLSLTWDGMGSAWVEFTELGWQLAGMLRRHKAAGGNWSNFQPYWK